MYSLTHAHVNAVYTCLRGNHLPISSSQHYLSGKGVVSMLASQLSVATIILIIIFGFFTLIALVMWNKIRSVQHEMAGIRTDEVIFRNDFSELKVKVTEINQAICDNQEQGPSNEKRPKPTKDEVRAWSILKDKQFSYSEISEYTGRPLGTIKGRISEHRQQNSKGGKD